MNIKEVVNLRVLNEFYEEYGRNCSECPFKEYCHMKNSMTCLMEDILERRDDEDLYDMEMRGTLDSEFQIEYNNTENSYLENT